MLLNSGLILKTLPYIVAASVVAANSVPSIETAIRSHGNTSVIFSQPIQPIVNRAAKSDRLPMSSSRHQVKEPVRTPARADNVACMQRPIDIPGRCFV
jgi:hypothetical protein